MEHNKEKNGQYLSVPQFGDWDQKGVIPDYSMDFSKIRKVRKENRKDTTRASLGNEEELINSTKRKSNNAHNNDLHYQPNDSPTVRRSIFSYFNCCVKA
ncbi:hypothetical protein ACP275_08G249900 [Erythranthe tilingii]